MKLAFLDTETTSLSQDRRAWEIGVILREDAKPEREIRWLVKSTDLDLGNADLTALNIGGFYRRHPDVVPLDEPIGIHDAGLVISEEGAMRHLEQITRGAHIIGINPHFDMELLDNRMRWHDTLPSWHYSPDCVKTLARGALAAKGRFYPPNTRSDDLFTALGFDLGWYERHTALGDCRIARDVWDFIMNGRIQHVAFPAAA